jgi:hypothetical protein
MVGMLQTAQVNDFLTRLQEAGLAVRRDPAAGIAEVRDGEVTTFWALQKGKGGPWIVRCTDSARVVWTPYGPCRAECPVCEGRGLDEDDLPDTPVGCPACNHTGYAPPVQG